MSFINNENLLTAIVPVRNMAGRLNVFNSWIGQIEKYPMQLIVVHDVFDKGTDYELKKIINHHSQLNIMLIEGKFGSPGYARNAGLEYVTGKWVAFWDSDDKPRLQTIISEINNAQLNDEILVGGFDTVNAFSGNINRLNENNASLRSVLMNPGLWRMVFKSKILKELKFSNLRMGEDQLFLASMNFIELAANYANESFYEYTIEQKGQLTNSVSALTDLQQASRILLEHSLSNTNKRIVYFDIFLIIRQQLTLIKKGDFSVRCNSLHFTMIYVRKLNLIRSISTVKALMQIFISIRRHKIK